MITSLRQLWADLMTPSAPSESLHAWGAIGVTHAALAAAGVSLLGLQMPITIGVSILVTIGYMLFKEWVIDLRKGGSVWDSLVDTVFVGLGAFAPFVPNFHLVLIAVTGIGVILKAILAPPARRG